MAHVDKFKRGAIGHLLEHDSRGCDNISNESIDYERSHLNYNLAKHDNPMDYYHQRLGEVYVAKRKDLNTLASWCVTVPKNLPQEEWDDFFQKTYDFSAKRYGEENVVSAFVHLDEKTPHLHFKFIPVVADDTREQGAKVCFDKLITRTEMRNYQKDLQKHLEKELGHKVDILNGATAGGNKTVQQMKAENIAQSNLEAEKRLLSLKNDMDNALNTLNGYLGQIESLEALSEKVGKKNLLGKVTVTEKDALAIQYYQENYSSIREEWIEIGKVRGSLENASRELQRANNILSEKEKELSQKEKDLSAQIRVELERLQRERTNLDRLVEEKMKDTLNFYDTFIFQNGLWDEFAPQYQAFLEREKSAHKKNIGTVERE